MYVKFFACLFKPLDLKTDEQSYVLCVHPKITNYEYIETFTEVFIRDFFNEKSSEKVSEKIVLLVTLEIYL